jgi:hypothetical protein
MRNIYFILFLLLFSGSLEVLGQQNLIYSQILNSKNSGTIFKKENDFFLKTDPESKILEQFINPENVDFQCYRIVIKSWGRFGAFKSSRFIL